MGLFDIFKKKKVDTFDDEDEDLSAKDGGKVQAPEVAIEGQVELKICKLVVGAKLLARECDEKLIAIRIFHM